MNKQFVIAGILGAAAAQTPCDGPFVKAAKEAEASLIADKTALEAKTADLTAAAATEKTLFDAAKKRVDDQATLMAPFETALATATANHKVKSDALAAANTAITDLDTKITAANTALTTSTAAVTAQNLKITAQNTIMAKLNAAVTEHTTGEALMQAALDTATAALATATAAKNTAITAKTTYTNGAKAAADAKKTTVDGTAGTVGTAFTTAETAAGTGTGGWNDYKALLKTKQTENKWKAIYTSGCNTTCATQTDDPVRVLYDAKNTASGNADTAAATGKSTYDTLRDTAMTKKAAKKEADIHVTQATTDVTTADNALIGLTAAVTSTTTTETQKTGEQTTATTNKTTATAQKNQAITDAARGTTLLNTLTAALVPLTEDVTVKTYLKKIQTDAKVVQEAAKTTANANLADLATLKTMAQETVTRAQTTKTFYDGLLTSATASKGIADGMVTANAAAIAAQALKVTAATATWTQYVTECKENGYAEAQAALKAQIDKQAADAAAATAVKDAYDLKAAFSTTGETNTLCAYPAKAKDAAQEPRPVCKDGYCCGAAQKFLKDGTKLSIETCQKAEGVHTYQYYPPLPTGAAVEPTPETWRFQCISGAQKLVATATAALAASYMMA